MPVSGLRRDTWLFLRREQGLAGDAFHSGKKYADVFADVVGVWL